MSFGQKAPDPAPRVQLEPNLTKILGSICHLIDLGKKCGYMPTQYDIVKSLFLADKAHLNRFGRPITFDNYVAMWHGPVPSLAYDLLKQNETALTAYDIKELPWRRAAAEHIVKGAFQFLDAKCDHFAEELSESDILLLKVAFEAVIGLTFRQVRELTHNDEAYKEAWSLVGDAKSSAMSLGLLFDQPDFEAAQAIEFVSHQQAAHGSLTDDYIDSLKSDTPNSWGHS